jgi:hypothetical protein
MISDWGESMRTALIVANRQEDRSREGRRRPPSVVLRPRVDGAPLALRLLLARQGAQALDVARHHGQGHIELEPIETMIQTAIQTMDLQGVDGRLHSGVKWTPKTGQ